MLFFLLLYSFHTRVLFGNARSVVFIIPRLLLYFALDSCTKLMLPAHFHDVAGDLFTTVEKFWDCPKFWQCSCYIVLCSLNSCYIRLVFGIFRNLLLYFVLGSQVALVVFLTKFGFINRDNRR